MKHSTASIGRISSKIRFNFFNSFSFCRADFVNREVFVFVVVFMVALNAAFSKNGQF